VSQENVEIVRRGFLDPRPLVDSAYIAPDAQFDFTSVYPDQPVLRGVEGAVAMSAHPSLARPVHPVARTQTAG